jgi:hypothetical protein
VPALWTVESYAAVHHLVSVVTAEPRPEVPTLEILRQAFPGGSITGAPKGPAGQIIAALEPHIPPMRVLMPGLGETPFATGARYAAALTSAAMGLNVSRRNDVYLYTSNRMPQMAGSGILTFVDRATGYGDVFGEDEFPFFDTEEELCAKLTEFHHDDAARRRVAEAGWRAYRREFSCTRAAAYLLAVIRGERAPLVDAWESL